MTLLILSASTIGGVLASQPKPNGSGYPYLWFMSWTGSSSLNAVGNTTFDLGGFAWGDSQLGTISVHADFGDGNSYAYSSTGTMNVALNPPSYVGFFNGPYHIYNRLGSFTFTVTLQDSNNNFDSRSVIVNVSQGPSIPTGVYGSGGRSPTKM